MDFFKSRKEWKDAESCYWRKGKDGIGVYCNSPIIFARKHYTLWVYEANNLSGGRYDNLLMDWVLGRAYYGGWKMSRKKGGWLYEPAAF